MDWEDRARRVSGGLTGLGLMAVLVGVALFAFASLRELEALASRSLSLVLAGFILGLVGSVGLLLFADRLPPGGGPGL